MTPAAEITANLLCDREHARLTLEERDEIQPPIADDVEAVCRPGPLGRDSARPLSVIAARLPARASRRRRVAVPERDRATVSIAIVRAWRGAGVPRFGPHALRHHRISLLLSWAVVG